MPANELVVPTNQIMVYGDFQRVELKVGANATAAQMVPGRLVIYDAAEGSVKEAGAKAKGVLGIIDVDATHKIGDTYAVADNIPILIPSQGSFVALWFLANEDFTQGDYLTAAANGLVQELAVGALGTQGDIVAQSWENEAGAANKLVVCKWLGQAENAAAA